VSGSLRGTRVLVTGADGFIGSHLTERLLDEAATVRAFCLYNSDGSLGWLDDLDWDRRESVDIRLGDIRDARSVHEAVRGVDVVFHLAALIAIPYSYTAPASFVDTNVTGTLNVLEAVRDADGTRMVHTSTSEVYGTPRTIPITESHPLRAQSPYSATKIAADKLAESYALSYDLPVVTLRPFNTYGPRQSARAVIPTILTQLLGGASVVHLGALDPRRDFTFVSDTVDGFVRMGTTDLAPGTTLHLGTGSTVSIGELFEMCRAATGSAAEVMTQPERIRPVESEVKVLVSDPSLARRELGWEPTVSLEDGIATVAEWLDGRVDPRRAALYHR
jgi:UDP-glucose 4-epimerase